MRYFLGIFCAVFSLVSSLAVAGSFGAKLCSDDAAHTDCQLVVSGDTWESLFPVEAERDLVRRLNRSNVRLRAGETIAVPQKLAKTTSLDLAPFPLKDDSYAVKTVVFSPSLLAWGAYDETGTLLNWGPASGGKSWCPDTKHYCGTPAGSYEVYAKGGARCKSHKFPIGRGGAPMPYCAFFHGGYAFHGSSVVPGYNASHGCVRVFTEDARWLNESFMTLPDLDAGMAGTAVIILSE